MIATAVHGTFSTRKPQLPLRQKAREGKGKKGNKGKKSKNGLEFYATSAPVRLAVWDDSPSKSSHIEDEKAVRHEMVCSPSATT